VADASVLSNLADGSILVIRHGQTTRDQVTEAVNRVNQVGGRLYGVVVNMVAKRAIGSYYYYYYEETSPTKDSPRRKAAPAKESGSRKSTSSGKSSGRRARLPEDSSGNNGGTNGGADGSDGSNGTDSGNETPNP